MKFRDPKTGEVFEDIKDAYSKFCCGHDCDTGCPLYTFKVCNNWSFNHPAEAARRMGYEEVEEKPMEQTKKPHICEVLGVEVRERATYTDPQHGEIEFEISSDGNISFVFKDGTQAGQIGIGYATVQLINHPDRIVRKPRFTEEEVATARALYATGARTIEYPFGSGGDIWTYGGCPGEFFRKRWTFPPEFFPSLRPGQSVALEDIIRADR